MGIIFPIGSATLGGDRTMATKSYIWKCIGFLLLPSLLLLASGDTKAALLTIGLIPFFFICWGLSILWAGKDLRDISRHLTETEREQSIRLAQLYGGKVGLFIAVPFATVCGFFYAFLVIRTILPYVLLFCFFMTIGAPFVILHRKKTKAFMFSTDYAKQHGYGVNQPIN